MEVKATLKPGNKGTIKTLKQYGDQLVQVRYRYDKKRQKRFTTIELIVDEQDWIRNIRFTPTKLVKIQIAYNELELRNQIKEQGAWWDMKEKCWKLTFQKVCELGLEKRIIDELGF